MIPSIFHDFEDEDEEDVADEFFREWDIARKHLINLKPTLKQKPVLLPRFLFEDDVPYVTNAEKMEAVMNAKVPIITRHVDQTDVFALFLLDYGTCPRVAHAIRVMLVIAPNQSAVERGYAVLKEVVSPKRCRMSEAQMNACVLFTQLIQDDLSQLPVAQIQQKMG